MIGYRGFFTIIVFVTIFVCYGFIKVKSSVEACLIEKLQFAFNEFKKEYLQQIQQDAADGYFQKVIEYKVKKGDNLESIARKFKVHIYQIKQWNHLKDDIIHPGQILKIKIVRYRIYCGKASWYGPGFHGKQMANGEIYDQNKVLIAHRHLPINTITRITNLDNSLSIIAPVLDRGPYTTDDNGKYTREVDLSKGAAKLLRAIKPGVIDVKIEPLS